VEGQKGKKEGRCASQIKSVKFYLVKDISTNVQRKQNIFGDARINFPFSHSGSSRHEYKKGNLQ
jgi:hypothetical protein